jgi:L-iditol 2-dehydrogenase
MKAIVSHGNRDFRYEDCPAPEVGPNDVLVEVAYCGLCGTDIHMYHGTWELHEGCSPGHEVAGVVRQVGEEVKAFKPGDRVAADPGLCCGVCEFCRSQRHHLCPDRLGMYHYKRGGFAELSCIKDFQAYKLPDGLPLEQAAFLEPVSCCVHGMEKAAIQPGQSVIILGGGAIGLIIMQLALLSGAARVVVSEPQEKRRKIALELGAHAVINPMEQDPVAKVRDICGGGDVVIECAGLPVTVAQGLDMVKRGGRLVLFGVNKPDTMVEFSPFRIYREEISIVGSVLSAGACPRALELIASKRLRVEPLISHLLPLKEFSRAVELHENNEGIKILLAPGM